MAHTFIFCDKKYTLIKTDLYKGNNLCPLVKKIKGGTTLGWNLSGKFTSYWQIKKLILNDFNLRRLAAGKK